VISQLLICIYLFFFPSGDQTALMLLMFVYIS
jgi:hypothetical protein